MKKYLSLFFLLILSMSFRFAGNPSEGVQLIMDANRKILSAKEIYLEFEFQTSCDDDDSKNEVSKISGHFIRKEETIIFMNDGVETIIEGDYILNVSHADKVIMIGKQGERQDFEIFLDFFSKDSSQFTFSASTLKDGGKEIKVQPLPNSDYDYLNQVKYLISREGWIRTVRMDLNRDKQPDNLNKCDWVEIKYKGISKNIPVAKMHSINQYIKITNNKAELKPAYKSYELISSLNLEMP